MVHKGIVAKRRGYSSAHNLARKALKSDLALVEQSSGVVGDVWRQIKQATVDLLDIPVDPGRHLDFIGDNKGIEVLVA